MGTSEEPEAAAGTLPSQASSTQHAAPVAAHTGAVWYRCAHLLILCCCEQNRTCWLLHIRSDTGRAPGPQGLASLLEPEWSNK